MGERLGPVTTALHRTLRSRTRDALRAAELRAIGHRAREVGLVAVATGALTGLAVAGFDRIVLGHLVEHLLDAPLWVQALAPAVGLALAALALRWVARGASASTADEYIKAFHRLDATPEDGMPLRPVPGRLLASAGTLGGGAALGFERPSIYLGAAIGTALQRRFRRYFARTDAKVLLVVRRRGRRRRHLQGPGDRPRVRPRGALSAGPGEAHAAAGDVRRRLRLRGVRGCSWPAGRSPVRRW